MPSKPIPPTTTTKPNAAAPRVMLTTPKGEVAVEVEIVSTPAQIERGLMYREYLPPDAGMLFLMGREYDWGFYMRNTLIPLDMIFITKDMTVAGIAENATPRTEDVRRVGVPSMYVLEVNGGWSKQHGLTKGARVRFDGVTR